MEELDFLHEVCLTALYSGRFVKFAAVVDNNGRLITAEYRKKVQNYWRVDFTSENHNGHDSSYLFHLDYLVPAIRNRIFYSYSAKEEQGRQQEEIHFGIIQINNNIMLALAPLNESKEKYLCIYIECSASSQEIISKLRNAII